MTRNDELRAAEWYRNGQRDALQFRESLAAVLFAVGDNVAAVAYVNGFNAGLRQLVA